MHEHVLVGHWSNADGRVIADGECEAIQRMLERLERCGSRDDGWTLLFRDPAEGSYWELSYQSSELHGGGPPTLTRLDQAILPSLYPEVDMNAS